MSSYAIRTGFKNGNYVVVSPLWANGPITQTGAVTWGNGNTGTSGVVSTTNSLVGGQKGDKVGGDNVNTLSGVSNMMCACPSSPTRAEQQSQLGTARGRLVKN